MKKQRSALYIKFALYAVVIVLINLAGQTLYQRFDLTDTKAFTLSEVSKRVVATLSEPLTIKVFFTQKLPPPHNNTEIYLQDLLKEYAQHGNQYFNYTFHDVSGGTEGVSEKVEVNREIARNYGINPVQIQLIEKDEVKFQQVYMGLVMIHGDIIERIPAITSSDALEYQLTTAMQKLNNKVSALLNLEEKIRVELVLSSSIFKVAPFMGLDQLPQYPEEIKNIVERLNARMYDTITYRRIDPGVDPDAAAELAGLDALMTLKWPDIQEAGITADEGAIGLLIRYRDESRTVPLLQVLNIPLIGTQYRLAEPGQVEQVINVNIERLVKINEDLGYLANFGTPALQDFGPMAPQDSEVLERFNTVAGKTFNFKPIYLEDDIIPDGLKTLIIAGPTQPLSDYALYQIDQALMRGTNLAFFVDAFKEVHPGQQPYMASQGPVLLPMDTGLNKLLSHYGVRIKNAVIMDEKCYRQRMPQNQGGGEQPLYFAPIIQQENINNDLDFIRSIRGLITLKISPLELDTRQIAVQQVTAHQLFASSSRSWEVRDQIMLNPMFLRPPPSNEEMASQPLAYLLEGAFTSYFKDKPMPEKPAGKEQTPAEDAAEGEKTENTGKNLPPIEQQGAFQEKSPPARIFIVASSEMIKDSLFDAEGLTTNAVFVMNVLDTLNGNEAVAVMRSKEKMYNPLQETSTGTKDFIKAFNIFGLPILVVIFGIVVWAARRTRRKRIQAQFQA